MKYGLCLPIRRDCSIEFNIELAKRAEALGFDSVWVSDHVVVPEKFNDTFSSVFYDPFVLLTAISAVTNKLILGTSVIILPYRNPVVLAKMSATLDVLSHGRLIMGIAAGWLKEEFDCLNADFSSRGKVTNEYVKAVKDLWGNEKPEFDGDFVSYKDINFYPKPFNGRIPDIWVGGSSQKAISRALELGSGWQPTWVSPQEYAEIVGKIKQDAVASGQELNDFTFSVRNRVRLENGSSPTEREGDPSYMFKGSIEKITEEVEKFGESGADYIVFDPETESDEESFRLIEMISEKIINK